MYQIYTTNTTKKCFIQIIIIISMNIYSQIPYFNSNAKFSEMKSTVLIPLIIPMLTSIYARIFFLKFNI